MSGGPPWPPPSAKWLDQGKDTELLGIGCTVTLEGTAKDCKIFRPVEFMSEETLRWMSKQR